MSTAIRLCGPARDDVLHAATLLALGAPLTSIDDADVTIVVADCDDIDEIGALLGVTSNGAAHQRFDAGITLDVMTCDVAHAGSVALGALIIDTTPYLASPDAVWYVLDNSYVALRRYVHAHPVATGIVLLCDPDRSISAADVRDCTDRPLVASYLCNAAHHRTLDAGLLVARHAHTERETRRALATLGLIDAVTA